MLAGIDIWQGPKYTSQKIFRGLKTNTFMITNT